MIGGYNIVNCDRFVERNLWMLLTTFPTHFLSFLFFFFGPIVMAYYGSDVVTVF